MPVTRSAPTPKPIRKAVVPAAGLGTRLRPLTSVIPKELLPIGRLPVLAYVAAELRAAGATEALFIVSERKPQIRAYFDDEWSGDDDASNDLPPLRCAYAIQTEQRGLGDAILRAEEWVGEDAFIVAFGDCLIESPEPAAPLRRLIKNHVSRNATASVLVEKVAWEKTSRYGILAPQETQPESPTDPFLARDIVEKPKREEAPSNLAVAARWILEPTIFAALKASELDSRGELNLTDPVRSLVREGASLWGVPFRSGEARRDIGAFDSFFAAFIRAALRDPQAGESARRVAAEVLKEMG